MNFLRRHKEKIIGTALGIIFLIILVRQVSLDDVTETFALLTWQSLGWTLVLTIVVYAIRSLRMYVLFERKVPLRLLFYITCAHNLANNVLPARSGELSFIYLIKRYTSFSAPYAATTLLVVRLLDLIVTLLLFPVLLFFLSNIPDMLVKARWMVIVFGMLACFVAFLVYVAHERVLLRLQSKTHVRPLKRKIAHFIMEGLAVVRLIKQRPHVLVLITVCTFGIWLSAFLSTYVLTSAMHLPLSYAGVAIGTTFVVLTSILPINSFLGIGVYEGAWTLATVSLGVPLELSIASGVTLHIIRIVTYVGFGAMGLRLFTGFRAREQAETAEGLVHHVR